MTWPRKVAKREPAFLRRKPVGSLFGIANCWPGVQPLDVGGHAHHEASDARL
jgi:hypothetical protein